MEGRRSRSGGAHPGGPILGRVPSPEPPAGLRLLPFYLGGFLGPFGSLVPVPMLPDLRDHFGVDSATISWAAISAYLLPMAGLLLVSGTIGERFGRSRVLRISLTIYLGASILVALAPSLETFLAARALQGATNAFFTPLLLASLAEMTPEAQLGRRIGAYSSFQAIGGAASPFVGGLAAEVDWRLAFVVTAVVTAVILVTSPGDRGGRAVERPPIRPLFARPLLALGLASFTTTAGPMAGTVLMGLKLRDVLDLDPGPAGLILGAGYAGPILLGPALGRLTDRYGARRCGAASAGAAGALMAAIGPLDAVPPVAAVWFIAGTVFALLTVALHRTAAVIVPENRGGALSAVLSFRFLGLAVGPLVWVPVLTSNVTAAFVGAGLLSLVTIAALLSATPAEPPRDGRPGPGRAEASAATPG